jgi:DNA modification methylase
MTTLHIPAKPYYATPCGAAYLQDSLAFMKALPGGTINLVMTSPPFALQRKKEYGNVEASAYVEWLTPFAEEIRRILTDDGSFVLDLGGSWIKGQPTRSLYHYEVVIAFTKAIGFHLAQEFFWYNPSKLPTPAEWVTVRRVRVKDAVNTVWWFSKTPNPKASNRKVLVEYSDSMKQLITNGYKPLLRPSGHDISDKFQRDNGGAIPSNLLTIANTESNSEYLRLCRSYGIKPHPARFPLSLPEFFIKMLTDKGDRVLDPFGGSMVTGAACERMERRWIGVDNTESYIAASRFRFNNVNVQASEELTRYLDCHRPAQPPAVAG